MVFWAFHPHPKKALDLLDLLEDDHLKEEAFWLQDEQQKERMAKVLMSVMKKVVLNLVIQGEAFLCVVMEEALKMADWEVVLQLVDWEEALKLVEKEVVLHLLMFF